MWGQVSICGDCFESTSTTTIETGRISGWRRTVRSLEKSSRRTGERSDVDRSSAACIIGTIATLPRAI
jgi:hypothetical protein